MKTRAEIQEMFVSRFHFGAMREPISPEQLDLIEAALNSRLPAAYRQFVSRYGAVFTPLILRGISEAKLDHPDVREFLDSAKMIVDNQACWTGGMPDNVIGVASDCMGNMIGFRRCSSLGDDAPVVFFDHDFVEVDELASSFDELLAWYLDHLPPVNRSEDER